MCYLHFCFVCLRLVYPMFPVSLGCPFLISSQRLSNIFNLYHVDQFYWWMNSEKNFLSEVTDKTL